MIESKFVLNRVLRRFELTRPDAAEPALQMGVTLLPKDNSLTLSARRRNEQELPQHVDRSATVESLCPFHAH